MYSKCSTRQSDANTHHTHHTSLKHSNAINSAGTFCVRGKPITATETSSFVTVRCDCGISYTMETCALLTWEDAIKNFVDVHPIFPTQRYSISRPDETDEVDEVDKVDEPVLWSTTRSVKYASRDKCYKRKRSYYDSNASDSSTSSSDED